MANIRICGAPYTSAKESVLWSVWLSVLVVSCALSLAILGLRLKEPFCCSSKSAWTRIARCWNFRYRVSQGILVLNILLWFAQGFITQGGLACSYTGIFRSESWVLWTIYGLHGCIVLFCTSFVVIRLSKKRQDLSDLEQPQNANGDIEQGASGSKTPRPEITELENMGVSQTDFERQANNGSEAVTVRAVGSESPDRNLPAHNVGQITSQIPLLMTRELAQRIYGRSGSEVTQADFEHAIKLPSAGADRMASATCAEELERMRASTRMMVADHQGFPFPVMPATPTIRALDETPGPSDRRPSPPMEVLDLDSGCPSLVDDGDSAISMDALEMMPKLHRCSGRISNPDAPLPSSSIMPAGSFPESVVSGLDRDADLPVLHDWLNITGRKGQAI